MCIVYFNKASVTRALKDIWLIHVIFTQGVLVTTAARSKDNFDMVKCQIRKFLGPHKPLLPVTYTFVQNPKSSLFSVKQKTCEATHFFKRLTSNKENIILLWATGYEVVNWTDIDWFFKFTLNGRYQQQKANFMIQNGDG